MKLSLLFSIFTLLTVSLSAQNCLCVNEDGKITKPFKSVVFSNNDSLLFCGSAYRDPDFSNYYLGELTIYDCLTKKELYSISNEDTYDLIFDNDLVTITFFERLPIGENWKILFIPIEIIEISAKGKKLYLNTTNFPVKPTIEQSRIDNQLAEYKNHITMKEYEKAFSLSNRLMVCALSGNKEAEKLLLSMSKDLDYFIDGHYGEEYDRMMLLYERLKKQLE